MAKEWKTSPLQIKVMTIVKNFLEAELGQYEGILDGGVHFKYKPSKIRLKVIELNSINSNQSISLSTIEHFSLNINYQDEDRELVERVNDFIGQKIDKVVIRNLFFEKESSEIFRISKYLWMENNRIEITNNTIYKNKKHNERRD